MTAKSQLWAETNRTMYGSLAANRIISKQFTAEFLTKDPVLHTEEGWEKSPYFYFQFCSLSLLRVTHTF